MLVRSKSRAITKYASMIRQIDHETVTDFEPRFVEAMKVLWADTGLQECYARRREYQLVDSAKHFLDDLDRIAQSDYLPSLDDILHAKSPTTGIQEHDFIVDDIKFTLVTVLGERTDRRKWIHYFETIGCIIYLVALSDYDEVLKEDDTINKLEETKRLFQQMIQFPLLSDASVMLLFNKKDLLEKKIMHSHLVDYFPQYDGPKKDARSAREFILRMFVELNLDPDKIMFTHCICALDLEDIRFMLAAIKDMIFHRNLRKCKTQ